MGREASGAAPREGERSHTSAIDSARPASTYFVISLRNASSFSLILSFADEKAPLGACDDVSIDVRSCGSKAWASPVSTCQGQCTAPAAECCADGCE